MQVQNISSALRCTIRPGDSIHTCFRALLQKLLVLASVYCFAEPSQPDKATPTCCLLCQEAKLRVKSTGPSQPLASATLAQTMLLCLSQQASSNCSKFVHGYAPVLS